MQSLQRELVREDTSSPAIRTTADYSMEAQRAKILIVDDQPENLVALDALLSDFGEDIIKAASGREALKLLLEQEFALILLDIQMPDMDGFETARLIRQRENTKHIPIIFLTAMYTEDVHEAEAYSLGAVDFMTKPFPPHVIRSKVGFFVELYKKNQHIQHQQGLILDMERKRLEEAKEKLEREKQLIQQELVIREKEKELLEERSTQLQRADRLKDEFLANMSHEIRTPMNAVVGFTDLLFETELSEEQLDYASRIKESSQGLLNLINDILDLSKIAAGKLDLEPIDFELVPLVEGTNAILGESARDKGLTLMTFIDPELPEFVFGDPGRIRQVLINLIGNAIKFTYSGEVVLRVTKVSNDFCQTEAGQVMVLFSVDDTGIGITEDDIDRLFMPFTQADGSTTRKFGGTGLGLSICKRLVELMQGEIGAMSRPGQGSSFWFRVPLTIADSSSRHYDFGELDKTRILVVDHQASSRTILKTYITSWGMHCDVSESTEWALKMLRDAKRRNAPYDLVITDLNMPEGDSFALLSCIKQDAGLERTRLILCTGRDQVGLGEKALASGFSGYLTKPIEQSRLFNCIVRVMNEVIANSLSHSAADNKEERSAPLILLAEDNPVNQKVTSVQLSKLGFSYVLVANGQEAIEACKSNRFNAILMDCQMPELDGLQATKEIRKAETLTGAHVPIIGLTAHAMGGDREKCIAAGMDDYLSKPVSMEKLQMMLLKWVVRNLVDQEREEEEALLRDADMDVSPVIQTEECTFATEPIQPGNVDTDGDGTAPVDNQDASESILKDVRSGEIENRDKRAKPKRNRSKS